MVLITKGLGDRLGRREKLGKQQVNYATIETVLNNKDTNLDHIFSKNNYTLKQTLKKILQFNILKKPHSLYSLFEDPEKKNYEKPLKTIWKSLIILTLKVRRLKGLIKN